MIAAFANPEIYESLEVEAYKHAIRLPLTRFCGRASAGGCSARSVALLLRQLPLPSRIVNQTPSGGGEGRRHSGL